MFHYVFIFILIFTVSITFVIFTVISLYHIYSTSLTLSYFCVLFESFTLAYFDNILFFDLVHTNRNFEYRSDDLILIRIQNCKLHLYISVVFIQERNTKHNCNLIPLTNSFKQNPFYTSLSVCYFKYEFTFCTFVSLLI